MEDVQQLILSRHFEQLPRGAVGEMGFIRGEIGRKRGHKPIRRVMKAAGSMLQRIKPVFLMSPISAAQFLPPGSVDFDLLLIDEASQVRPEEALARLATEAGWTVEPHAPLPRSNRNALTETIVCLAHRLIGRL